LADGQCFLGFHRGLVGSELAAWQRGTAVDFIDPTLTVQLQQVAPDGGLADVQGLAKFLYGGGAFFRQQRQNLGKSFFCKHGGPPFLFPS